MTRPWYDRWPVSRAAIIAQILLCIGHCGTILTGLAYIVSPSASVEKVLAPGWALSWSLIFVVFGIGALLFRLKRAWREEAVCLFATAGGLIIWGVVSLYATIDAGTFGAVQVSIRLITGAIILAGFAFLELEWVKLRKTPSPATVEAVAQAAVEELKRREIR